MSGQLFAFALLACLAAVHSAKLNYEQNTEVAASQRESRILEIPTLGDVIYTGLKATWFLVSTAWSLVGYKLAAIALVADVAIWVARNCFSAILGAAVTLAFCKLTGKCSLDYAQEYEIPDSDELSYAAKHLDNGRAQYTS